jgi:hypothetical protein
MENVESIKSLVLTRTIQNPFYFNDFKLKDLKNLNTLSLNDNELEALSATMFVGSFEALEIFDASHNRLIEIDMSIFNSFLKLEQINLAYNFIQMFTKEERLNSLDARIFVDNNTFQCDWLQRTNFFEKFIYTKNFKSLNIDGLPCTASEMIVQSMPEPIIFNSTLPLIEGKGHENLQSRESPNLKMENFFT